MKYEGIIVRLLMYPKPYSVFLKLLGNLLSCFRTFCCWDIESRRILNTLTFIIQTDEFSYFNYLVSFNVPIFHTLAYYLNLFFFKILFKIPLSIKRVAVTEINERSYMSLFFIYTNRINLKMDRKILFNKWQELYQCLFCL